MIGQLYEKNIAALIKTQPSLVSMIEEVDLENQDDCVVFEGVNGCNVLKVKNSEGSYILYNSFYDPYKEAKEITSHLDYEINRSLIISVGLGLGYHLKEILSNLNEKSVVIAAEQNKLIMKNLLCYVDFSEEIKNAKIFFVMGDFTDRDFALQLGGWMRALLMNVLYTQPQVLPVLDYGYIRYCKEVFKYMSNLRTTCFFSLGNSVDDTIIGIDNRIKNLSHIIKNPGLNQFLDTYKDVYKGKPAIIIASGPSLDKNIHLLKEAQGKALLLACDGSLESLRKNGITPDAVGSVERILLTYEAFYKDKEIPYDTVLVAPAVVRPEIFQSFKNKTLSLFKNEPIGQLFNKMVDNKGTVWSGASVAHHLFGVANALGAEPIVLVGQDLAYSPDGVSHTSDAAVKEKVDLETVNLYVKDIHGNDVPTTFVWKQFKEIFEEYFRKSKIACIDATEGGAYIEGTQLMTLREVVDTYCVENIPKFRDLVDKLEVEDTFMLNSYCKALKSLINLSKKFFVLKKKAQKSKVLNQKAKKLLDKGIKNDKQLKKVYDAMDYTEHKIVRRVRRYQETTMVFQYPIMQCINKVNDLGTEVTFEVLSKNLDIHKELLNTFENYSHKIVLTVKSDFELLREQALKVFTDNGKLNGIIFPQWIA